MAGKHRGEPLDESAGMVPILDGLVVAVEAAGTRATERGEHYAADHFSYAKTLLLSARQDLTHALTLTNGENDGTDER